jgi:hypothetical protein
MRVQRQVQIPLKLGNSEPTTPVSHSSSSSQLFFRAERVVRFSTSIVACGGGRTCIEGDWAAGRRGEAGREAGGGSAPVMRSAIPLRARMSPSWPSGF